MGDLISRQDAIDALGEEPEIWNDTEEEWAYRNAWVEHISALKALPSAEPKTGRWVPVTNGRGGHECDQCHNYAPSWATGEERLTNFCPNCGAKMEGGEEE